jgi:hypothetical protein
MPNPRSRPDIWPFRSSATVQSDERQDGRREGPAPVSDKATLRDYIEDIKRRIGTVGDQKIRLAVVLGPLSFDHSDDEVTRFIALGFELALETEVTAAAT